MPWVGIYSALATPEALCAVGLSVYPSDSRGDVNVSVHGDLTWLASGYSRPLLTTIKVANPKQRHKPSKGYKVATLHWWGPEGRNSQVLSAVALYCCQTLSLVSFFISLFLYSLHVSIACLSLLLISHSNSHTFSSLHASFLSFISSFLSFTFVQFPFSILPLNSRRVHYWRFYCFSYTLEYIPLWLSICLNPFMTLCVCYTQSIHRCYIYFKLWICLLASYLNFNLMFLSLQWYSHMSLCQSFDFRVATWLLHCSCTIEIYYKEWSHFTRSLLLTLNKYYRGLH